MKDETLRKMGMLNGLHVCIPNWDMTSMPSLNQIRDIEWIIYGRLYQKVYNHDYR